MLCTLVCGAHITLSQSKNKKVYAASFLQTIISVKNLKYLVVIVYHNAISEEGGHDHVIATAFQGQEV